MALQTIVLLFDGRMSSLDASRSVQIAKLALEGPGA
jgi:hypothetical protein